jgi:selenocysteine-specific elongation factor
MSGIPKSSPTKPRSVIIGTAGHIDHGKTALIRALTGIDTDRLPEEKRRGITIDLGFASMEAAAPDGSTLSLSFIDVPGHARFVHNMLAGAGGIDAVLLVISAEEGVKPQTEEHLAICTLLGIARGITVLTKADAVSEERLRSVADSVRAFLQGTFLAAAPLMAVSARSGSGIDDLLRSLMQVAEHLPTRCNELLVRLPIDRIFTIKGFGTVVTGTLIGGSIRSGDELTIEPHGRKTKVRGIQVHGHSEELASSGSRVALNLARVETTELHRGDTLVAPSSVRAVDHLDAELILLPGVSPLKHRARVHFHGFASECLATITVYGSASIEAGEGKIARLRLSRPIVLLPGDRFVLRQGSPLTTISGGLVLDAHPLDRAKKAATADWLKRLRSASAEDRIWLRILRRGVTGISPHELSNETGAREEVLRNLIAQWTLKGRLHSIGAKRLLTCEAFDAVRNMIAREFDTRIRATPAGVKRSELKSQMQLDPEVVDAALQRLEQDRQLRVVGEFFLPSNADAVPERDRGALATVSAEFKRAGLTPPSPDELAVRLRISAQEMQRLITALLRNNTLVRLGSDSLCVDRSALVQLAEKVRTLRGQTLDVAAFKQLAGVSRKYAIPLLEYLDRQRITVKRGDQRFVL